MAVLDKVIVRVIVNGQALEEYDDPDNKERESGKTVKYIESQSSVEFSVRVDFSREFRPVENAVSVCVCSDGVFHQGRLLSKEDGQPQLIDDHLTESIEGVKRVGKGGKGWVAPFSFKDIESTRFLFLLLGYLQRELTWVDKAIDISDSTFRPKDAKNLGAITVRLHHYNRISSKPQKASEAIVDSANKISEKLMKGSSVSHSVRYG